MELVRQAFALGFLFGIPVGMLIITVISEVLDRRARKQQQQWSCAVEDRYRASAAPKGYYINGISQCVYSDETVTMGSARTGQ